MEITVLKAICRELVYTLPGLRLASIDEDEAGVLYLTFKTPGKKHVLLVNPRPGLPRLYLTRQKPGRSRELTPFAQSLVNHIAGSSVKRVGQEGLERAVTFHFTRKTKMLHTNAALVLEMTGKKPNLILLDEEGRVLLAQSYVSPSEETLRPVLPGLNYIPPPAPAKLAPDSVTETDIERILQENPDAPLDKALFQNIGGISPLIASEAAYRAGKQAGAHEIHNALKALLINIEEGPYNPCIYEPTKGPVLSALALEQFSGMPKETFATMNEAAESFYSTTIERRKFSGLKNSLLKENRAKLTAAQRKLGVIEADLKGADRAGEYQIYGNLLMASLGSVPEGADSVTLPNIFSAGEPVMIPLDPRLSPVKNAEGWFKKAKKAKAGVEVLGKRLKETQKEAESLKALLERTELAHDLSELAEFSGQVFPKRKVLKRPGKPSEGPPGFPSFISSDGYEVMYAKNARANDILTFKVAEPMDLWLHAQGYHGAHVIVRNPERRPDIPLATILEAAEVAAYYSEARKDSSVPVDYTFKKYVRKPKKPTPGQAIFTNNKTVFVEPRKRG